MEKIEAAKDKKSTNLSKARKNYIKDTPYLDIGIGIKQMTPSQFKKAYKGEYSQLFKYVRNTHNLLLSNKDINKKYKKELRIS